jgi:hypothetical protein
VRAILSIGGDVAIALLAIALRAAARKPGS